VSQEGPHVHAEAAFNILMFGRIHADRVGRRHHVADPNFGLGAQFSMFSFANAAYIGLVDNG